MTNEPYIRKKGDKFVIEEKKDGKTHYLITLPDAKTLFNLLKSQASSKNDIKASQSTVENKDTKSETFAQSLLNEQQNKDANTDLLKALRNEQNKLMEDILKK